MPILPPDASEEAVAIWHDVAESITIGDFEKLHDAIKDFITLSVSDKKILEDMASVLPPPGIPPMLLIEIFGHPEATVGLIERLGSEDKQKLLTELGTSEQAIVLDALISWLKTEGKLPSMAAMQESATNPLNLALKNYVSAGAGQAQPINLKSLQFLKNNAVTLAGLKIADPVLLNEAYQKASEQLLITLLPDINTSNLTEHVAESGDEKRKETLQKRIVDDIKEALQDGAIPLNMQTYLVLWTAITLPDTTQKAAITPQDKITTNASIPVADKTPDHVTVVDKKVEDQPIANAAADDSVIITKTGNSLPSSPIVASVLAALPTVVTSDIIPAPEEVIDQITEELGMVSYIYTQMAPYWSGPAAVSLMTAIKGPETVPQQKKLESSVRAFAISLGTLLNDPSFDQMLIALIKKAMPTASQEQLKLFIAAMKISVLTNALVALYIVLLRKTQGQFRADELLALILGPPIDERIDLDDLQKGIIKSIRAELLYLPAEKRALFMSRLLSCYSQYTDINALIDPTKQFLNLCDPTLNIDSASNTKG